MYCIHVAERERGKQPANPIQDLVSWSLGEKRVHGHIVEHVHRTKIDMNRTALLEMCLKMLLFFAFQVRPLGHGEHLPVCGSTRMKTNGRNTRSLYMSEGEEGRGGVAAKYERSRE